MGLRRVTIILRGINNIVEKGYICKDYVELISVVTCLLMRVLMYMKLLLCWVCLSLGRYISWKFLLNVVRVDKIINQ